MSLFRVCPPARRQILVAALAALAAASSFAGLSPSPAFLASASSTVPYVEPPAPTPPDPMPARPTGRLVPAQGSLFGIHTIPDAPTAKTADGST